MTSFEDRAQAVRADRDPSSRTVTLLPDPARQPRYYTLISVDDHIVEPPDAFEGRLPARLAERGPRLIKRADGVETWLYDGIELPNIGFNAVAGRPLEEMSYEPTRFADMRRGSWDIRARLHDMDLDGVYASLNFPSFLPGFAGIRMQTITTDHELALASIRAWNDWHIESWAAEDPARIIPCQLTWLHDPEVAAEMVRANALRGFKALSFPEATEKAGFPSIHTRHWDPLWTACEETETPVCVHIGSAGTLPPTAPDAPPEVAGVLFGGYAMMTTIEWLYSSIPLRFPNIKIVMSEGGIGWVPSILDRLDHRLKHEVLFGTFKGAGVTPVEVLRRNFWFCALDDPSTMGLYERIGIDRILVEADYPHSDSSWPDTQAKMKAALDGLPEDVIRKVTWQNASELFRHPVPEQVVADPESF
jgi:predicted TIM-barrel fold metal-dependent hydrolase